MRGTFRMSAREVLGAIATFHALILVLILAAVSTRARFVPSPLGALVLNAAAIALGLALAGWLMWVLRPWTRPRPRPWLASLVTSTVIAVPGATISLMIGSLFACWYTDLTGSSGQRLVTVSGYHDGFKSCHAFKIAEARSSGAAFCADAEYLARHPVGSKLRLAGRISPLGMHAAPIEETNP